MRGFLTDLHIYNTYFNDDVSTCHQLQKKKFSMNLFGTDYYHCIRKRNEQDLGLKCSAWKRLWS